VSKTRYTIHEQFEYHKKHIKQLQSELAKLESASTNTNITGASNTNHHSNNNTNSYSFDKDKYNYLQFEIQRYNVYINLLEEKIVSENSTPMPISQQSLNMQQQQQHHMINPAFDLNDHHRPKINAKSNGHGSISINHYNEVANKPAATLNHLSSSPTKSLNHVPHHGPNGHLSPNGFNVNHLDFNISPSSGSKKFNNYVD
jgi:hypothetical protein